MRRSLSQDSSTTSPDKKKMRSQTDKNQLYDRQLRLWHESGQMALESAHVCVFGSSALASEALKNLVLPGIGRFTVIDDAIVDSQDMLTNFFVQPTDVGKSRAQCIVDGLSELNPDAKGTAVVRAPANVLESHASSDQALVSSASLVIACGLPDALVHTLGLRCWQLATPLIVATTAGFMASMRTSISEHAVVESHAEIKQDLRLASPFPDLLAYADAIDLSAMDPTDIGHVPFVAIIIKAMQRWATSNGLVLGTDTIDIPFRRLDEIRAIIRELAPSADEENFAEAVKMVSANCSLYEIPSEVSLIINDRAAAETDAASSVNPSDDACVKDSLSISDNADDKFWLMAKALRRFTESAYSKGALPLSGTIPDMKADTKSYIALQRVYKQKADQDKAELAEHLREILKASGLPQTYVSQPEIDAFCKNAHRLRLLRMTPVHAELKSGPANTEDLKYSEALFPYVMFRSSGIFFDKHAKYPGVVVVEDEVSDMDADKLVEKDAAELSSIGNGLLNSWGMSDQTVPESLAAEFARSGCDELHNIASLSGGMIAQEAIKLITHQYVPANNLCIIDGANAKIHTIKV